MFGRQTFSNRVHLSERLGLGVSDAEPSTAGNKLNQRSTNLLKLAARSGFNKVSDSPRFDGNFDSERKPIVVAK